MKQTKIALIDDHTLFRKCLVNYIRSDEQNRYFVLFDVHNGKELMNKLSAEKKILPDIIIMDINMPGMDGFEAVELLQRNYPAINILVVSMIEKEEAIIRMLRLGVKGYLSKDIDPEDLYRALDEVSKGEYHYTKFLTGKLIHSVITANTDNNTSLKLKGVNSKWDLLSNREKEFVKHACSELTYSEIATKMFLAPKTIDGYRDSVFEKLEIKSRVGLVLFVLKNEMIQL